MSIQHPARAHSTSSHSTILDKQGVLAHLSAATPHAGATELSERRIQNYLKHFVQINGLFHTKVCSPEPCAFANVLA